MASVITPEIKAFARGKLEAGHSYRETAAAILDRFGFEPSVDTIRKRVGRSKARSRRPKKTPEIVARCAELRSSKLKGHEIAEVIAAEFGVRLDRTSCTNWAREHAGALHHTSPGRVPQHLREDGIRSCVVCRAWVHERHLSKATECRGCASKREAEDGTEMERIRASIAREDARRASWTASAFARLEANSRRALGC